MISKNWRIIVLMFFTVVFSPHLVFAEDPLTLESSIDIALKNSIVINIAKEGLKSATAQKKEAMTGFLPKFSTSYSYTRLNEDPFNRFYGFPPGPLYGMNNVEIPVGTKDNYNWIIEAKQPLFAGGGILANYQASSIGENIARLEETSRYQDVVQEVKIAYFDILRAQSIEKVAGQSVENLIAHRDVAENYFKVGIIPKNDLLHAEVQLANGKLSLVKAKNAVELAKSRFNTVLKRGISEPVAVVDILTYHPFKQSFEECLNIALNAMPELKAAQLKAQQAGKLVKVAQSEYFPALSVVGNYSRLGDEPSVSGSDYKDMESWYLMAVASWNFWEWGKTKYRVDTSKARENQAIDASKELNDQVILKIKNAYLILQETENQISVSQKLIEQAEENFRISEERYKERVATSTEVLDAQTLLTEAKSEYANALADYNVNYAKLQRAMGIISAADEDVGKKEERNIIAEKKSLQANGENLKTSNMMSVEIKKTDKSDATVAVPAVTKNSSSVSIEQKTTKSVPEEDVRILVNKWLTSWQSGDMKAYRDCYASDFKAQRMDLNAWISNKTKIRQKHKNIAIRIGDLKISSEAETSTAKAVFTQYYSSSTHNDKVRKTLQFIKEIDGWKIYKETVVRLK